MKMDLEYGMRPVPIPHWRILARPMLKLSPEGEGFNPPKRRQ
jgi:hypothetical protein